MEPLKVIEMPYEDANEFYGTITIDSLGFEGKDELPKNLLSILDDYIIARDEEIYWNKVGKHVVKTIEEIIQKEIPDFKLSFDEVYGHYAYGFVESYDSLAKYCEEHMDEKQLNHYSSKQKRAELGVSCVLRNSAFDYNKTFSNAAKQPDVISELTIDLDKFKEDYNLEFTPEINSIDELHNYSTDDEIHYIWTADAPGQMKFDFASVNEELEILMKNLG